MCARSLVLLSADEPDLIRHAVPAPLVGTPDEATPSGHERGGRGAAPKPMFAGINMQGVGLTSPSLTSDFIKRLKDVIRAEGEEVLSTKDEVMKARDDYAKKAK